MKFEELTEKEFDSFFKKHPLSTFLQSLILMLQMNLKIGKLYI